MLPTCTGVGEGVNVQLTQFQGFGPILNQPINKVNVAQNQGTFHSKKRRYD